MPALTKVFTRCYSMVCYNVLLVLHYSIISELPKVKHWAAEAVAASNLFYSPRILLLQGACISLGMQQQVKKQKHMEKDTVLLFNRKPFM